MSDTVGNALAQRLVNLSSTLSSFVSSWERSESEHNPETHDSDFVQNYVEKYDFYFRSIITELEERGYDDPLFRFVPERVNAEHLRAVADRLAIIASEVESGR